MELLIAAWLLGMAGSLHCVGMCGPIALALPVYHLPFTRRIFSVLTYHAGRIMTYAALGLVFSLLGAGIALAGYQQVLSVVLGLLLVLLALISMGVAGRRPAIGIGFNLKKHLGRALGRKTIPAFFLTGLLNGLLPCGMIYVALAGATVSPTVEQGILFMVLFGLGTLPAMVGVAVISTISVGWRRGLRKASPVLTIIMGVLLVARGLGLGIPFISPDINRANQMKQCAHPLPTAQQEAQTH